MNTIAVITSPKDDPPPRWRETRALIRADVDRIMQHLRVRGVLQGLYARLQPSFVGLLAYRLSRHLYLNGWRGLARGVSLLSLWATRVEIPPTSAIGPGCLICHASGVIFYGRAGARLTLMGHGGTGGGRGEQDIGGGPGYPVLGDDVTIAQWAAVFGPVRVGHGVRIGPASAVTRDVPDGALVLGPRPRVLQGAQEMNVEEPHA
jgi:serine O-acetyltransferase